MPLVSVVVPAYNCQDTLERTLTSIFAQEFQDYEVILVDDASQDATLQIARSFADPRIKILQHEQNRGEAGARNTGLRAAVGDYVAWLDTDDEWLSMKLARQVAWMQDAPSQQRACGTGYLLTRTYLQGAERKKTIIPIESDSWHKKMLSGNNLAPGATLMVRRQVFEEVGEFDEQLPHGTDMDWLIRYSQKYGIGIIPQVLAHVNQAKRPRADVVESSLTRIIQKYSGEYHAGNRSALACLYLDIAWLYYYDTNQTGKQRDYFQKAFSGHLIQSPFTCLVYLDVLSGNRVRALYHRLKRLILSR